MRVAVDFSHGLVMIDLKTLERRYFLVPAGKPTPVEVDAGTVRELLAATDPQLVPDLAPAPQDQQDNVTGLPEYPTRNPEPVASVRRPAAPQEAWAVSVLSPGSVGEPVTPQDAFGVQEG